MYRKEQHAGSHLGFLGVVIVAAAMAHAQAAAASDPVVPLSPPRTDAPAQLGAIGLPPCVPGAHELCTLPGSAADVPTVSAQTSRPFWRLPASARAIGIEAAIGAGVTGFIAQRARAFANPGGSWDVRLTLGARLPLAFEGAYIGSKQNLAMLGLERNGVVLGNGGESTIRFNIIRGVIEPYIIAGAGWTRYQLVNTRLRTADGRTIDDVFQVPFGAGLTARSRHAFADVRGTARLMYNDNLVERVSSYSLGTGPLASWCVTGRVGWQF